MSRTILMAAIAAFMTASIAFIQGCISKDKANQLTHQINKQRSLRVFTLGHFRANAFFLKPGLVVTNKHVCDTPDFLLVNNEGVAQAPIESISSKDFDLCLIKTAVNEKFDYNIVSATVFTEFLGLEKRVEILGYSLKRSAPNPVLTRSAGVTLEIVDMISGQTQIESHVPYFDKTLASTLPIIPGCSGSAIYSRDGVLVGVANAVTNDGLGVFVMSSNLIKFLEEEAGVSANEYARTNSIAE